MKYAALLAVFVVSACATYDRVELSSFEPTGTLDGTKTFKYRARADALIYRLDTPEGEAERMRWLDTYVSDNKYCANGYIVTSREPVLVSAGVGNIYDIFYRGKCK